jgi:hypothetical protein
LFLQEHNCMKLSWELGARGCGIIICALLGEHNSVTI